MYLRRAQWLPIWPSNCQSPCAAPRVLCMCICVYTSFCSLIVCVWGEPNDCQFDHQIPSVRWRWIMPLWGIEGFCQRHVYLFYFCVYFCLGYICVVFIYTCMYGPVCVCCMCKCMYAFVCVCVCMEPNDCQFDHQIPSVRWRWIMPLWGIDGSSLACQV
jgi:hypothetical protein